MGAGGGVWEGLRGFGRVWEGSEGLGGFGRFGRVWEVWKLAWEGSELGIGAVTKY